MLRTQTQVENDRALLQEQYTRYNNLDRWLLPALDRLQADEQQLVIDCAERLEVIRGVGRAASLEILASIGIKMARDASTE